MSSNAKNTVVDLLGLLGAAADTYSPSRHSQVVMGGIGDDGGTTTAAATVTVGYEMECAPADRDGSNPWRLVGGCRIAAKAPVDEVEAGTLPGSEFDGVMLVGMLFAEIKATVDKIVAKVGGDRPVQLVVATPDLFDAGRNQAMADAAVVGGFAREQVTVVAASRAAAASWALKHPRASIAKTSRPLSPAFLSSHWVSCTVSTYDRQCYESC
jgi:hypothetical protein